MQKLCPATDPQMVVGRKPLGGEGGKTLMVPMRWDRDALARIDSVRGDQDRSAFIREAVEAELSRREGK